MAWSSDDAKAAAFARLSYPYAPRSQSSSSVVVEGTRPARMGMYSAGRFRKDGGGLRVERDASLEINEAVEVYYPGDDQTAAGREGFYLENGEPYVRVADAHHTLIAIEILSIPAFLPDSWTITLKYKMTNTTGTVEMITEDAVFIVEATDTLSSIAEKAIDAIAEIYDFYGNPLVACWDDQRQRVINSGAESDAQFACWLEPLPNASGNHTIFIHALSHHQDFASVSLTQFTGGTDFEATVLYAGDLEDEPPRASLRTNKIRDNNYTVATAMRQGEIQNPPGVFSHRHDVDTQGVNIRSQQGAGQLYHGETDHAEGGAGDRGVVRFKPEVVTQGVHRKVAIELDASFWTDGLNILQEENDMITVRLPWPDETYYEEGPVTLVDAHIEVVTPYAEEDGGGGPVPLNMDVGIYTPQLFPSSVAPTEFGPLVSATQSVRGFHSSVLRNALIWRPGNSARPAINVRPRDAEYRHFADVTTVAPGSGASTWMEFGADPWAPGTLDGISLVPCLGPFPTDVWIAGYGVEYQHATATLDTSLTPGEECYTELYVCEPNFPQTDANFAAVDTLLPGTSFMYQWGADGTKIYLDGGDPGDYWQNRNVGFILPAGYKLAIKIQYPTVTELVSSDAVFQGYVDIRRDATKGEALSTTQSIVISPFDDPGYVFATLYRAPVYQLDSQYFTGTPPGDTLRNALVSYDTGKLFLHLHFWQHELRLTKTEFAGADWTWGA